MARAGQAVASSRTMWRSAVLLLAWALACGDDDGPSRELGPADALSVEGCEALTTAATPVTAPADRTRAASVGLHPRTAYRIALEGTGYVTFHLDVAHHDWSLAVTAGTELSSPGGLFFPPAFLPGSCEGSGLWEYRVHGHEIEDVLLDLRGPDSVWFYASRWRPSRARMAARSPTTTTPATSTTTTPATSTTTTPAERGDASGAVIG